MTNTEYDGQHADEDKRGAENETHPWMRAQSVPDVEKGSGGESHRFSDARAPSRDAAIAKLARELQEIV